MKSPKLLDNYYKTHIFCCVNERKTAPLENCCAAKNSNELQEYFKTKCREYNINNIRINKSGCLGRCKLGKVMVIYPEAIWYHYDTKEDIELIISSHLLRGKIVEKLVI